MEMRVKKLYEDAKIPTRGSAQAAGYDLYANKDAIIYHGETVPVGTGIAVEIPTGYFGALFARSGLATKQGLRPANCVGVIDSDYRGEIIVAMHNDNQILDKSIGKGERIAQLVIIPYLPVELVESDTLEDTERGANGFGSTGKN